MTSPPSDGPPGGDDGSGDAARRELLREYREFIRTHHPDRGGDPEAFVAGLARYRELLGKSPGGTPGAAPGARPRRPATDITVYRRGSLPAQVWRLLTDRHQRRRNPRVE